MHMGELLKQGNKISSANHSISVKEDKTMKRTITSMSALVVLPILLMGFACGGGGGSSDGSGGPLYLYHGG